MPGKLTFKGILPRNLTVGCKNHMDDRSWETCCILTNVCNSLNAESGRFSRTDPFLADLLGRAQSVIMVLLDETGRLDEYDEWGNSSRSEQTSE